MNIYHIPPTIKGLLFDIDSTLYRNDAYYTSQIELQIRRLAELRGEEPSTVRVAVEAYRRDFAERHDGKKPSLGNTLADRFGISIETSVLWRDELLQPEKYLKKDARLDKVLGELSGLYRLWAVTNNTESIACRTLETLGISRHFAGLTALDHSWKSKPHPESFQIALQKTKLKAEQLVSIGDRYAVDIEVPLKLGMGGILVESMDDVYQLPRFLTAEYFSVKEG